MRKILFFLSILMGVTAFSQPPTNPSTAVNIYGIEGDRASLSITRGNGAARIVIIKKDSPVTFSPVDGTSYLANTTFGDGQEVAPGEFVIMSSASNNVTVANLIPSSTYHIAIFEFNGSGITSFYLVSPNLISSFTTLSPPSVQATSSVISNLNSNTLSLSWTPGNGAYSIVLAKEGSPVNANPVDLTSYYAQNTFYQVNNGPAQIGVGNFVLYKGTGNTVNIDNLNPNTTYHFAVFSFNGSNAPVYLTTNPTTTSAITLSYPTVQVSNLLFDTLEGDSFRANWTAGNGAGRIAIIREEQPVTVFPQDGTAYIGNQNFLTATDIGGGHKVIYSGAGNNVNISNLTSGVNYYIAVFEYAGAGISRTYNIIGYQTAMQGPIIAPTQNVISITASLVTDNKATLTMQPGNGSGRFVVVRANEPTSYEPIDLNSYYANNTPNLNDNSGNVGNGNEVVYKGTGNVVNITNAIPNTTYYVTAYEFNGNSKPIYNKTSPAITTFTTLLPPAPTLPSTNLTFSKEGNSLRLQWSNGNGQRRIVVMSKTPITAVPQNGIQYVPNSDFSLATEITLGEKIVFDGTTYSTTITALEIGTTYYVRIYEYNGTELLTNYLTTTSLNGSESTAFAPTISSSNLYVEQINQDQIRVYWTNGNGQRKLIIGRLNEAVDAIPEDLTAYSASSYFNSGAEIAPGQRAKYYYTGGPLGIETNAIIYSISPGNTYHFKIFEANGVNAPVYNTTDPASASYTVGYEPLTPSTNLHTQSFDGGAMTVYISNTGGGQKRIIVAKEGSPVTFLPQDGVDYAANNDFSLGLDLGDGQKVISNNASYFANVTGLEHSKTYHFAVFEYGGTGSNIDYLTSSFGITSGNTLLLPTQQASSISFNGTTSLSSNVSWTNGDGTNRLVIAKKSSPVDVEPQDYTNYSSYSSSFGTSGSLGNGNYIVYKGNSNNFNLTNLLSGTNYEVAVFEFNGTGTPIFKKPALTGSFTTLGPPQEQAQLQAFTNITTNSGQINCISGSGQKRLIVMKAGSPISAFPSENTTYIPNSYLGSGSSIGDDTFVVYNGFDSQVTVTGLAQGVTYYVAVFEFNSFSGGIVNYLTPSTAIGNFTTIYDLCFGITCPPGFACDQGGCFPIAFEISGIVRDATSLLPLENVSISSGSEIAITDAQGFYTIIVLGGDTLTLSLAGYQTLTSDPITSSSSSLDLYLQINNPCEGVVCPTGYSCLLGGCFIDLYNVSGIVRDATTLLPLENVIVSNGIDTVFSDDQGNYSINVEYGLTLSLTLLGYQTLITDPIYSTTPSLDLYLSDLCVGVTCPPGFYCDEGLCIEITNPCDMIPPVLSTWYPDVDEDGFGDENNSIEACEAPIGYIDIGGDCDDVVTSINPGATEICYDGIDQNCNGIITDGCAIITATLRPENCGQQLTSINQVVRGNSYSQSIPNGVTVTGYRFRVTNLITNAVRIVERSNYIFQLTYTDFAEYDTPYSVEVALRLNQEWMEVYGAPCTITTPGVPNTILAATSCGATVVQLNNIIRAVVVPSALNYEYNVALIEGGFPVATTTLVRSGASFNLLQLTGIPIKFGAEYSVTIRVEVPTSSGPQWSTVAGATCSVFTPFAPEVTIEGCDEETGITPANLNTVAYADPIGGATQYRFTLTNGLAYNQVYVASSRFFRLSNFNALSPLTAGETYSVYVEAEIYGYYYAGKDCNILVPGGILIKPETEIEQELTRTLAVEFKATIHPNPFAESFSLELQTKSQELITLTIYDMTGRLIETKTLAVDQIKELQIGNKYPTGIYNALVKQGETTTTIRVVKM
ncbi:MopE-related protein [Flavobacterium sp.]|uniref:MopE-related protein n=1 Tax=Flavobacterium sp. TaxID=239 RepID=UPI00260913F9|nr:MopE-related protein [Flavobacterium sp.]MDD2986506.1 MopE-related protein [Flavobacterium sp.]